MRADPSRSTAEPATSFAFPLAAAASGGALILWELLISRVFAVVLFADLAHLALGVAMLGMTVGALAESLSASRDDEALRPHLSRLLLGQAFTSMLTVAAALYFPVIEDGGTLTSFYARDPLRFELLDPAWFIALSLILTLPAAFSGALVAALFRRARGVAAAYAADLGAAGLAAALFLPASALLAAPDLALAAAAIASLGAIPLVRSRLAMASALAFLVALGVASQRPLLRVQHAAGWSERFVVAERWTPTTRLALFRGSSAHGAQGDYLLLDNGSASLIVREQAELDKLSRFPSRGLVHALHAPGRVAVLAAGAGPEAAVALAHGHTEVLAVDLDEAMFALVREQYGAEPLLAYSDPQVETLALDARAAMLRAPQHFDIIHLVWANFFGAAGRMNAAWTPQLLYTREAIGTYLDRLTADGTLSLSGPSVLITHSTALAALRERGAASPEAHTLLVAGGDDEVLLVKPRPFRAEEREAASRWLAEVGRQSARRPPALQAPVVLSDDRPYPDSLRGLRTELAQQPDGAIPTVYRTLVWGLGVSLACLGAMVGAVWIRQRPAHSAAPLLLALCLGYGYLAVQVVLVHQVVLYVGHPTLAFATVLGSMLLGSGMGGGLVARLPLERLRAALPLAPLAVALLAVLLQGAWGAVGEAVLLAPTGLRVAAVALSVGALGFLAGMPMPGALRLCTARQPRLGPLMWAFNGWASVLAATLAILLARLFGYEASLLVAVGAYLLAALCAWRLSR